VVLALLLGGCGSPLAPGEAAGTSTAERAATQPEGASGWQTKPGWLFPRAAVAAAHPLAAEAGADVLRAGGNAMDAAVAVQMVLALVEPQSSGIGGGALLLHWDGREVAAWDGRETAPAAADERLFLQADGRPMPFLAALVGGRSVGVPGAVRMLEAAHRVHGRLPWARLFEPAIALAERGFRISPRLHRAIASTASLSADPLARAYFYGEDGRPLPVGHLLRNPALAAVLRALAERGSAALHEGPVAADLVARVRGHASAGRLTLADLAGYAPVRRSALCSDWQAWRVCGFPPPSSGQLTIMQMLGLLGRLPPVVALAAGRAAGPGVVPGADWLHAYTEAARLAYADRDRYIADPAFTPAPGGDWRTLLDPAYLAGRAAGIGERSIGRAAAGEPGALPVAWAPMPTQPEDGTSHVSIVDAGGQAVSLTTSVESAFGARLMSDGGTGLAGGFPLNNQLTDFSFVPADAAGRPVANRVQPGKRPRSSMAPTFVFDAADGRLQMVIGSPGGASIIHYTAKTLLGTLAWRLDAQRAIDLPNFGAFNTPATMLEAGRFPPATAAALRARGHVVNEVEMTSGVHALRRTPRGWSGGADARREGVVAGD